MFRKGMQVEEFVADPSVKRLDVRVLRWHAELNEMQVNAALCGATSETRLRRTPSRIASKGVYSLSARPFAGNQYAVACVHVRRGCIRRDKC